MSSTFTGFVSFGVSNKLLSIVTGDGGGDSWGELPASFTLISSPILSAVCATIAVSSASSSSDEEDKDKDKEEDDDDADDDDEDMDEDDDDDDDEDMDEDVEFDDECVGSISLGLCISNSLMDIFLAFFFLGRFLVAALRDGTDLDVFAGSLTGDLCPLLSLLLSLSSLRVTGASESELDSESELSLRILDVDGLG